MTNEELFADLKQFIEATVSQQMAHVATRDDLTKLQDGLTKLQGDVNSLHTETRAGFEAVDARFDETMNVIGETVQDHDRRINRLEQSAA